MLGLLFAAALWIGNSAASPTLRHARVVGRDVALDTAYDFVIVGGGTSGLTVADRLTENPDITVLVIEYGPFDRHEDSVLVPGLLNLSSTPYFYDLFSTPQSHLNNGTFRVPAAAVVGGGTVINGMFFDRGANVDYDAWANLGNPGWSGQDLLAYFKKSEAFTPPDPDFADEWEIQFDVSVHGTDGPVQSSYPVYQFAPIKSFFEAWKSLDVSTPSDPGAGIKAGAFWAPSSLDPKDETRSYARVAHFDRVIESRPNYHLIPNHVVERIIIEDGTATGVQFRDRNTSQTLTVSANKEVILAAGAPHSPQILQLSGVGPKVLVEKHGMECKVDLPGVGQNLQDHPTIFTVYDFATLPIPNVDMLANNQTYAEEQLDLYWSERKGAYTIVNQGGNIVSFLPLPNITSDPSTLIALAESQSLPVLYPDLPSSTLAGYEAQRAEILRLYTSSQSSVSETGYSGSPVIPVTLLKPLSRGSVSITSSSALDSPQIDFGAFTDPTDLETFIAIVRKTREFISTPAMQRLTPTEIVPGANRTTDEELREVLRASVTPSYSHPCCSNAMMPLELGGVVDSALKVYGVERLRVVDASIMPIIPAAHLSATVYAVAEKAADIIKEAHGLR